MKTNNEKKIKVLMLGPSRTARGGIASVVNRYYDGELDKLVQLVYLPTVDDGSKLKKLIVAALAYVRFVCMVGKCDIVHVHMASRNSFRRKRLFISCAHKYRKKIILHLHGGEFEKFFYKECSPRIQAEIQQVFFAVDRVVVLSEQWRDTVSRMFEHRLDDKLVVLYNAVKIPEYERHNYRDKDILFLGRLETSKGTSDILACMKQLLDEVPDVCLHLCGDGEAAKYEAYCEEQGLNRNVVFYGWIDGDKKQSLMERCSVFVLPSYNEGLPMSMLEAMSYHMAVVCSDVGGIPTVIYNDGNGLMIHPGDVEGLKEALIRVLKDPEEKQRLAENAYGTVNEKYNIYRNVLQLLLLYKNLYEI